MIVTVKMGKTKDLTEFERGMVVGARRLGFSISKTANVLDFSHATVSRVFRVAVESKKLQAVRTIMVGKGWRTRG